MNQFDKIKYSASSFNENYVFTTPLYPEYSGMKDLPEETLRGMLRDLMRQLQYAKSLQTQRAIEQKIEQVKQLIALKAPVAASNSNNSSSAKNNTAKENAAALSGGFVLGAILGGLGASAYGKNPWAWGSVGAVVGFGFTYWYTTKNK